MWCPQWRQTKDAWFSRLFRLPPRIPNRSATCSEPVPYKGIRPDLPIVAKRGFEDMPTLIQDQPVQPRFLAHHTPGLARVPLALAIILLKLSCSSTTVPKRLPRSRVTLWCHSLRMRPWRVCMAATRRRCLAYRTDPRFRRASTR